jgi:putative DNA primase/helicase
MSGLCWANILDCTGKNSTPRSTLANAVLVLQHDPQFIAERLWYDEFLDRLLTLDEHTTRQWRDDDDTRVTVYLQQTIGMATVSVSQVADAVRYVARQRVRHCVRDRITAIEWDGVERIAHAFEDFWGVTPALNQPLDYVRAVSANFFLALIARVFAPGCQVDTMVIFEGAQGIGKSRALRIVGGEYYMLAAESVTSKDFFQVLSGCWLVEIGEMDSFSRAERERTKLVISTPVDRYRPSYARYARDFPRQCVFAGTTNHDDYGNDDTGLRRFLPVHCGEIDIAGLTAAVPQLFAEALVAYRAGRAWWEVPQAATAQADRQAADVWTDGVLDYVIGKADVSLVEVLRDGLRIREADMTRVHELRVSRVLKLHGWVKKPARRLGKLGKRWFAPDE